MGAEAVNRQHRQRKKHTLAKIRNAKNIGKFFKHRRYFFGFFLSGLPSDSDLASAGALLSALGFASTFGFGSGFGAGAPPIHSALPPAFSIFSCADLENLCACTESAELNSPSPSTLTRSFFPASPFWTSNSRVILDSPSSASRSTLITVYSVRKMLVKPRLGRRRCRGIWPPSKPRIRLEPEREPWPLWPRVDVLPMPDPIPRPTRLRSVFALRGARRLERLVGIISSL